MGHRPVQRTGSWQQVGRSRRRIRPHLRRQMPAIARLDGLPIRIHRASFPDVLWQRQHRANERVRTAILIDQSAEFPGFIVTAPIIHDKNGDPVNSTQ